jgi:SAM-dependent methyltransferase
MAQSLSDIYAAELKQGLFWYEFITAHLPDLPAPGRDRRLLDFGCGGGGLLAALTLNGYRAEGVEINPQAMARCQGWGEVMPGARFPVMHFDDFCRSHRHYDLVILRDVVEHLTEEEFLRLVLRRTTAVFIATPNRLSLPLLTRDPHSGRPFISILSRRQIEWWHTITGRDRRWRNNRYAERKNYYNVELFSIYRLEKLLGKIGFNTMVNLSTLYYRGRPGRRLLTTLSNVIPQRLFEIFVAPEIVLYGSK